jgi:hypothetical protein
MLKKLKHPKDMTTDEAIAHVFHPKALKHLKKHLARLAKKTKRQKSTK